MTLIEILIEICRRDDYEDLMTVYAKKEWRPDSEAIITMQPEDGNITPVDGFEYFLEVSIIKDWVSDLNSPEVGPEQCNRIIQYATYDA